jgi:uncharacterized protein YaaN involved in tellurite resistance
MSARFADRPDHAFGRIFEEAAPAARSLSELRRSVERLDSSGRGLARRGPHRSRGILRRRQPLARYLDSFAESEGRIRELIETLRQDRSDLRRNNAVIDQEQRSLATLTETLRQYAYLAQRLDESVEVAAAAIGESDPERGRFLVDHALFPIRQRRQEILTHLAVSAQGLAALAIVRSGNDKLIQAVDTVTTATIAALRTAALVAVALTNEDEVAAQLRAWADVFAALDTVDAFTRNARGSVGASMRKLADPGADTRGGSPALSSPASDEAGVARFDDQAL